MTMPTIEDMARDLNAAPADLPGLWNVPGYPELTTGQLVSVWRSIQGGSITVYSVAEALVRRA